MRSIFLLKKSWSPLIFGLNSRLEFLEVKREEKTNEKIQFWCSFRVVLGQK
jgi:hypothetical protein